MTKKTIGYFGDSFCGCRVEPIGDWKTYMEILEDELDLETTHLGQSGSSVGDLFLNQLMPVVNDIKLPDISVFFWTNHSRLFHRKVRNLNFNTTRDPKDDPVLSAAKQYYDHLWDGDYAMLEYTSIIQHLDRDILPQIASHTKIIHVWSFGEPMRVDVDKSIVEQQYKNGHVIYPHTFTTGVEIRPPMMAVALQGTAWADLVNSKYANHLDSSAKNRHIADMLKHSIVNYEKGK